MRLDIGALETRPSDQVPGLTAKLQALMPGIYEHRCSVGEPGGFLQRVEAGTYAGHVVEHVAIELQNMIGFSVGYGKTVDTYEKGVYSVVLPLPRRSLRPGRRPRGGGHRRKALQWRGRRYRRRRSPG